MNCHCEIKPCSDLKTSSPGGSEKTGIVDLGLTWERKNILISLALSICRNSRNIYWLPSDMAFSTRHWLPWGPWFSHSLEHLPIKSRAEGDLGGESPKNLDGREAGVSSGRSLSLSWSSKVKVALFKASSGRVPPYTGTRQILECHRRGSLDGGACREV